MFLTQVNTLFHPFATFYFDLGKINYKREGWIMFLDTVVIFGMLTVLLMCVFFGGLYLYIREDIKKHGTGEDTANENSTSEEKPIA